MDSKKALISLASLLAVFLIGTMVFNYVVDPQCYYRCDSIDINKKTVNSYYKVAQSIVAQPDNQVVILGSSRGENTSPLWVQKHSGLKTINLSVSGAELTSKMAFLNIALESGKIKKVIWLADYFELITKNANAKIKNTPSLRKYLKDKGGGASLSSTLNDIQGLLNHNTTEASFFFLSHEEQTAINQGAGSDIDFESCDSEQFAGKESPESLRNEVDILYQNYSRSVLAPPQSEDEWIVFQEMFKMLESRGVELVVVIPPYHPDFIARLKKEHPDLYQKHLAWVKRIAQSAGGATKVLNYFEGIPGSLATPAYWNDGVHFTCKSSSLMLKSIVSAWKLQ
ncbi:MAG: hypothetical protein ACKOX6_05680 [Bdellovibrio sp.]